MSAIARGCSGKVRLPDAKTARLAAQRRKGSNAYHCRHCDGWHVAGIDRIERKRKIDLRERKRERLMDEEG